jgi:pSer/pThr/pTyr-binding forkhead associated (FHA) protein
MGSISSVEAWNKGIIRLMSDEQNAGGNDDLGGATGNETIVANVGPRGRAVDSHMSAGSGPQGKSTQLPTLYVLSSGGMAKYPMRPDVFIMGLGNDREESDIVVRDSSISGKQLVIIKIGGEWLFLDCGTRDRISFNGRQLRQYLAPINCRTSIKVGEKYMLFVSNYDPYQETATVKLKKDILSVDLYKDQQLTDAKLTLKLRGKSVKSVKKPVLIGTEDFCDLRVSGPQMRPAHAQVFWADGGIFVEPLGEHQLVVNKQEVEGTVELNDGDRVHFGRDELEVKIEGDYKKRCAELYPQGAFTYDNFALTALANSEANSVKLDQKGQAFTLGRPIIIGRAETCDIVIRDSGSSREHAQLIPSNKSFILIDNYSSNGTFVNGERITKMRVRAGDIVEFGNSYFLVHYS